MFDNFSIVPKEKNLRVNYKTEIYLFSLILYSKRFEGIKSYWNPNLFDKIL